MNSPYLYFLLFAYLFTVAFSSSEDDDTSSTSTTSSTSSNSTTSSGTTLFEIYLPYRLDFFAEMKLTTIFPRKFMYALKDYASTKAAGRSVLSMPNYSSGALSLGMVHIGDEGELEEFLGLMDDLSKRVFRTGLNESTAGGNFRLPMNGIGIDPASKYIYAKFDLDYPTDSHRRFVTFMKSFFYRLARLKLNYEACDDLLLNQLVLGQVSHLEDINLPAFKDLFANFNVGFATFNKILVMPAGTRNEKMRSVFYFDHVSHEPIIGIENTVETEDTAVIEESVVNTQQ